MSTIGFVGLGSMGAPIAGRLLRNHQVTGTNRLAVQAMTGSAIGSPMLKTRAPLVLDLPEQAWFDVELMHKDIRLALEAARESGVPLPSTSTADSMLSTAAELGYGHRDIAALFQVLGQMAAPDRGAGPGQAGSKSGQRAMKDAA